MNRRDGVECTPFGAPFPSPRRTPPRFPRSRIPDPGSGILEPPCGLVEVHRRTHCTHKPSSMVSRRRTALFAL